MKKTVKLLEFGDYQCPYCAKAYVVVKQLQKHYGDEISFEFRNFPLVQIHPLAFLAAEAAEAARDQGKFNEMHDALFENQDRLGKELILELARRLALDEKKFFAAIESRRDFERIKKDVEDGQAMGVNGTPAFFIEGEFFDDQWSFAALRQQIDRHLGRS